MGYSGGIDLYYIVANILVPFLLYMIVVYNEPYNELTEILSKEFF